MKIFSLGLNNKKVVVAVFYVVSLSMVAVFFQNCADSTRNGFSSLSSKSSNSTSNLEASYASLNQEEIANNTLAVSEVSETKDLLFYDSSYGDASKLLRQSQKIVGAKTSLLRGCTGPSANFTAITCTKDSEFMYIKNVDGWSYDSVLDTYSIDLDISEHGWPTTSYTTVILFPDGQNQKITFKPFVYEDTSYGNGSSIIFLRTKIIGLGADVKACTNPIATIHKACSLEKDFVYLKDASGWTYNSSTDTYSINLDISFSGYPHVNYFTKLISANGKRYTVFFEPVQGGASSSQKSGVSASSSWKWTYTEYKFCVGPTPSPAPIGQSCGVYGQTVTNACGTATCM
jgi:hypothetical protein